MKADDVKWLHIELSSKCNAACPACGRNNNGYGVVDGLVEEDLAVARIAIIMAQLPNLHAIQLCGNFGDPVMSKYFMKVIHLAKQSVEKIQIHTNGSLRSTAWWTELAVTLKGINHDVWFGLDGIGDVHEIYRQGTSYDKVINNATAFIKHGGHAIWQFIPYAHNEHQIKDALKLSQQLGFKQFKFVKMIRSTTVARHHKTGTEFVLAPPKKYQSILRMPSNGLDPTVEPSACMHLTQPSVYLAASGKLSACCYFSPTEQYDTLTELFDRTPDLTNKTCVKNCGK